MNRRAIAAITGTVLIAVLLVAGADGRRLTQLEGWTVDAVTRAERGGEDVSGDEGRATAMLQIAGEDVRRIGPDVRPEVVPHLRLCQLGEVVCNLLLRVAPGELRV